MERVLQYRLSGYQHFDERGPAYRAELLSVVFDSAEQRWSRELKIPDQSIPNRSPLSDDDAYFDPLTPRTPLYTWRFSTARPVTEMIDGLSRFLADPEIRALDDRLRDMREGAKAPRRLYQGDCLVRPEHVLARVLLAFDCEGPDSFNIEAGLIVEGAVVVAGDVDRIALARSELVRGMRLDPGPLERDRCAHSFSSRLYLKLGAHSPRRIDGSALENLRLTWRRDEQGRVSGKAYLTVVDDYEPVRKAITAMAEKTATGELDVFTAKSFRRETIMRALFAELGSKPKRWCCADEGSRIALDVERLEVAESDTGVIRVFQQHCGACHRTQSASPPNFLYGTQREVMANLSRCAQRIYFRLNMWRLPGEARPKSPMPPALVVRSRGHTPDQWRDSEALLLLTEQAAAWVRSTTAGPGDAHALLERDYATLGKCL